MAAEEPSYDPDRCMPCRGTGRVTSGQGEVRTEVECPWCGGTGRRQPGRNAQEFAPRRPEGSTPASKPESPPDGEPEPPPAAA